MEAEWYHTYSVSHRDYWVPTQIKITPAEKGTLWGSTEFAAGSDDGASEVTTGRGRPISAITSIECDNDVVQREVLQRGDRAAIGGSATERLGDSRGRVRHRPLGPGAERPGADGLVDGCDEVVGHQSRGRHLRKVDGLSRFCLVL